MLILNNYSSACIVHFSTNIERRDNLPSILQLTTLSNASEVGSLESTTAYDYFLGTYYNQYNPGAKPNERNAPCLLSLKSSN